MRFVIQRVRDAIVTVQGEAKGSAEYGLLVYVGITTGDGEEDVEWMTRKTIQMRIFPDENGVMNKSLLDVKGQCLLVSQFTLYASTKKGNRPSYLQSARAEISEPIFNLVKEEFGKYLPYGNVATGVFGADMDVMYVNSGPVTIILDSKNRV